MSMSETAQSRKATEQQAKFDKISERLNAYKDKMYDPATPDWEKKEMQDKLEAMTQQIDKAVKRQSTSEPPPEQEPPAPERPGASTASSGGVSQSGPTPQGQPTHVVTPVSDKDKK